MKDLFIMGTGEHGQEMVEIIDRINQDKPTWNLIGFLDPKEENTGQIFNECEVIGTPDLLEKYPDAKCIPAYGFSTKSIDRSRYVSIFDPKSSVSRTATFGVGCVIYPNCFVGLNARIGDFLFCLSGSVINHDDVIGNNVILCTNVSLAGFVKVGSNTYMGQASTVRQCLEIGQNCLVGMGSVVVKNVEDKSVVVGNPARFLRKNEKGQ